MTHTETGSSVATYRLDLGPFHATFRSEEDIPAALALLKESFEAERQRRQVSAEREREATRRGRELHAYLEELDIPTHTSLRHSTGG